MKVLSAFPDVRTRLLALVTIIIVPAALVTILLAAVIEQSSATAVYRERRQSTEEYAIRTRIWAKGAARMLFAAAASATNIRRDRSACGAMLQDVVDVDRGYKAIRVDFDDGHTCAAAEDANFTSLAAEAGETLRSKPRTALSLEMLVAAGVFRTRVQNTLAIQVDAPPAAREKWVATGLVDPTLLVKVFELNPNRGDAVALMERGETIVAASGASQADTSWLPATEQSVGPEYQVDDAPSRSGTTFAYATQSVLGSNLYILSRFDNTARQAVRVRFLVLALAPLIMLATLYFAYSWAIQSELLRWIDGIKSAVLARKRRGGAVLAPEDDEMPVELRELGAAFNEMALESASRERSLESSVAENEILLRELHHRVKNSLQIIQSYLALTRRLDRATADSSAVGAMEARVQVLSIAYGKALSEGRMRDVRIRQFAAQIVDSVSRSYRHPGIVLELRPEVHAAVSIDRAIPLGLALVESIMAGLEAKGAHVVAVQIDDLEDWCVAVRVSCDGAPAADRPDAKLMAGLALQLDATAETPDAGTIMRWRIQAGPPPVLASTSETKRSAGV